MTKEQILDTFNITDDVLAIYPYGSIVYGNNTVDSDTDYIIVMKASTLPSGAFKQNAISSKDRKIQAILYSRGGFMDAINNYEIGAMECLSLPEDKISQKRYISCIKNFNVCYTIKRTQKNSRFYSSK